MSFARPLICAPPCLITPVNNWERSWKPSLFVGQTEDMSSGSQIKALVCSSLPSNEDLEREARELVPEGVVIDQEVSHPKSFTTAEPSVRAVLVCKNGPEGAVRVTGRGTPDPIPNVVTGPEEVGWEIIAVKTDQTCMFFGNPTVRFFRSLQT